MHREQYSEYLNLCYYNYMKKFTYFAYGSNMLLERLKERCESAEYISPAYVCGYELNFNKRSKDCSGKATIVENRYCTKKLYGALFQIDEKERSKLDRAEGNGYTRIDNFVVVQSDNNNEIETTTYFAKSGATGRKLRPYSWYKQLVLWGAVQSSLPATYLTNLVAIQADRDPNNERNDKALCLLRESWGDVFIKGGWDMKIAGHLSVADWRVMEKTLEVGKPENWEQAYKTFFVTRIETRYFEPIKLLQKHGKNKGEGFSIVTLQCSLIEFLASIRDGVICEELKIKDCSQEGCSRKIITNENYVSSAKIFKDFLKNNKPFNADFNSTNKADSFYKDVRCALLHDARTKESWKIRAKSDSDAIISWGGKNKEKILYRNNLQSAFEQYIKKYGEELKANASLQEAFIAKFDALCEE
ncbi:MAG: gamma-glutamylcyclotransferase [Devosiaceae bacterium]|nr:gamma-glutamylcyclotransferase [Devosiaceae bacterium]